MAKKQTRRSISISRSTYERLKAFCEVQGISMSQVVEGQIGGLLANTDPATPSAAPPRPIAPTAPRASAPRPVQPPIKEPPRAPSPMTSQAARYAVEPPPPIIKPREPVDAKPPTPPTADQIFTF